MMEFSYTLWTGCQIWFFLRPCDMKQLSHRILLYRPLRQLCAFLIGIPLKHIENPRSIETSVQSLCLRRTPMWTPMHVHHHFFHHKCSTKVPFKHKPFPFAGFLGYLHLGSQALWLHTHRNKTANEITYLLWLSCPFLNISHPTNDIMKNHPIDADAIAQFYLSIHF